jgi:hypothetical protein
MLMHPEHISKRRKRVLVFIVGGGFCFCGVCAHKLLEAGFSEL